MDEVLYPTPSACWPNAGQKPQQDSVFFNAALAAAVKCPDGSGIT
jgi:hypothetical protein